MTFLYCAAAAIVAYLIGSINFGIIVSKLFYKNDIRNFGSGNPGATNAYRTYGTKAALIVLLGDMLKGVIAVFLARLAVGYLSAPEYIIYISGVSAVVGHMYPVFFKFKGGKGVATTAGAALFMNPLLVLILIAIFAVIVICTRYVSLGSVTAAALFPVGVFLFGYFSGLSSSVTLVQTVSAAVMGFLIILKHRGNIAKLVKGTENKIVFNKK